MRGRVVSSTLLTLWIALCVLSGAERAVSQQIGSAPSAILTIEADRLFADSRFGQRVAREREADFALLSAENRRIEADLIEEERDLTERRATMEPEAFRALADAFDAKVQDIRRTQDAKARALTQQDEADRVAFLQAAAPVLEKLMREAGAAVLLERGNVFLSLNTTDITDLAIRRIDAIIGEGESIREE